MQEKVISRGSIFELVQLPQPDGRIFEVARRAPGVRLIIHDEESRKVLLTREFRRELGDYDYRLPGGKVFDTLDEFAEFRKSGDDMLEAARSKASEEAKEEAGIDVGNVEFYYTSKLGTTVEWDLYVFETSDWKVRQSGQELGDGEDISAEDWFSYEEVRRLALDGAMQEDRVAMVLMRWLEERVGFEPAKNGKLVRDKIPEIIRSNGEEPICRILDDQEYLKALFDKLCEEADELRESQGDIGERADVAEVLKSLDKSLGFSEEMIEEARVKKAEQRGGFESKIFLNKTKE